MTCARLIAPQAHSPRALGLVIFQWGTLMTEVIRTGPRLEAVHQGDPDSDHACKLFREGDREEASDLRISAKGGLAALLYFRIDVRQRLDPKKQKESIIPAALAEVFHPFDPIQKLPCGGWKFRRSTQIDGSCARSLQR